MNVLEFTEKPPLSVLATMSVDTLELGFGEIRGRQYKEEGEAVQ